MCWERVDWTCRQSPNFENGPQIPELASPRGFEPQSLGEAKSLNSADFVKGGFLEQETKCRKMCRCEE
jgi:hypothetical protein